MSIDKDQAISIFETQFPGSKILMVSDLPDKYVFACSGYEGDEILGTNISRFYSVDKRSGELLSYSPFEEEDPSTYFDAPTIDLP